MLHGDSKLIERFETAQSTSFQDYRQWKESKWGEDRLDEVEIEDDDVYLELSLPWIFANPLVQFPPVKELLDLLYSRIAAHSISLMSMVISLTYYYRHPSLIWPSLKDLFGLLWTTPQKQRQVSPRWTTPPYLAQLASPLSSLGCPTGWQTPMSSFASSPQALLREWTPSPRRLRSTLMSSFTTSFGGRSGIDEDYAYEEEDEGREEIEEEPPPSLQRRLIRLWWRATRGSVLFTAGLIAATVSVTVLVTAFLLSFFIPATWLAWFTRRDPQDNNNRFGTSGPGSVSGVGLPGSGRKASSPKGTACHLPTSLARVSTQDSLEESNPKSLDPPRIITTTPYRSAKQPLDENCYSGDTPATAAPSRRNSRFLSAEDQEEFMGGPPKGPLRMLGSGSMLPGGAERRRSRSPQR